MVKRAQITSAPAGGPPCSHVLSVLDGFPPVNTFSAFANLGDWFFVLFFVAGIVLAIYSYSFSFEVLQQCDCRSRPPIGLGGERRTRTGARRLRRLSRGHWMSGQTVQHLHTQHLRGLKEAQ